MNIMDDDNKRASLKQLKKYVETTFQNFRENYQRFNDFRKFTFNTSMTEDDISLNKTLMRPQLEFNICEAYISRQRGEFSKQEPSIEVRSDYDNQADPETIKAIEGYLRHAICDADKNGCSYNCYTDSLSGGFSVIKVWTEYANEMSFDQVIKYGRVFDPTLCGFDPLANLSHKGDGRFCFEMYPMTKDEFSLEYPDINISDMRFSREIKGFNWSYRNEEEDILLICKLYLKRKEKRKIVNVANNKPMFLDDYKKLIKNWDESSLIQKPQIIGKTRETEITYIDEYTFIEHKLIEVVETSYKYLPLVFVDGNSALLRDGVTGSVQQMTRPYLYHAKGVQRLKNFAGQCLANELENMVMHKFKVAKESIPAEYADAYTNYQVPNVLIYNAYKDNDPNVPIPAPQEIARVGAPPEVISTFSLTDQVTQAILGSYDASLGINNNQLSGVAIVEGATQSNSAAMPYVVSYMQALNQIAQIYLDLIPKFYVTPRTVPVMGLDGRKTYQAINQQGGVNFQYSENAFQVSVEAGVNFAIQKSRALQQMTAMMSASPIFAQFMNTDGLEVLLDNMEMRGIDQLKQLASEFTQNLKQQQAQSQSQPNPQSMKIQIDMQKLQMDMQKLQADIQLRSSELQINKQNSDNDKMKIIAEMQQSQNDNMVQLQKTKTEQIGKQIDYAIKAADMSHRHAKETHELNNLLSKKGEES